MDPNTQNECDMVSVVMCTYNGGLFVAEQIQSILSQTYPNLEIIIVDDASTDNTYEILKEYAEKDSRIILYRREENAGFNINFSEACAKTTGEFIAIADQDDIWELQKIEKLLNKIKGNRSVVLVHGISARFEERTRPHLQSLRIVNYFRGNDIRLFYLSNYVSGHSILFRKILLNAALPFPPNVYYDWWLAANACVIGEIEFVNEILVWHRMHQSNATGKAKPKLAFYRQVQSILPAILRIHNMAPSHYKFGIELLKKYNCFPQQRFSWPLFWFLLKHSPVIFSYKKRTFPWMSYIKHSWRYAKRTTLA